MAETVTEPEQPPEAEPTALSEQEPENASREAANYRRRLRETEAERDALAQRLERYERAEVEAIARREGMATPADLWAIGTEVPRTESGEVDAGQVQTNVRELLRERPTWRSPVPDLGSGARAEQPEAREPGLSALLKPRRS
jgi:hypothetical protein